MLGRLEDAADLARMAMTCNRLRSLIIDTDWPHVRTLRLWHWLPAQPPAKPWLCQRLSGLEELDASGCQRFTQHDLAAFWHGPLKVCARQALQIQRMGSCCTLPGACPQHSTNFCAEHCRCCDCMAATLWVTMEANKTASQPYFAAAGTRTWMCWICDTQALKLTGGLARHWGQH